MWQCTGTAITARWGTSALAGQCVAATHLGVRAVRIVDREVNCSEDEMTEIHSRKTLRRLRRWSDSVHTML